MSKIAKYVLGIVLISIAVSYFTVYQIFQNYLVFLLLRLLAIFFLIILNFKLFYALAIKKSLLDERIKNVSLVFFSVFTLLLILESVFTFIPRSHGVGFSYAAKNWNLYYMSLNSEGFRDLEKEIKNMEKKKIVFLGDSFTKGAGIKNKQNRFADITMKKLDQCYEMFILAKGGMNTINQLDLLKNLSFVPDIIVYQYYGNDIEGDAINSGFRRKRIEGYKDISFFSEGLAKSSYLFNYFYWLYPKDYLDDYSDYIAKCYSNDEILKEHIITISKILEYGKMNNSNTYCVMIPYLQNLELSKKLYIDRISGHMNSKLKNGSVIEIIDELKVIEPNNRIVNSNDSHANEKVNLIIADKLINELEKFCN